MIATPLSGAEEDATWYTAAADADRDGDDQKQDQKANNCASNDNGFNVDSRSR